MALNTKHFLSDEGVKPMKKIEELNKSRLPIVKIEKSLGKYKDKVLFKEKVEKANETLKIDDRWWSTKSLDVWQKQRLCSRLACV